MKLCVLHSQSQFLNTIEVSEMDSAPIFVSYRHEYLFKFEESEHHSFFLPPSPFKVIPLSQAIWFSNISHFETHEPNHGTQRGWEYLVTMLWHPHNQTYKHLLWWPYLILINYLKLRQMLLCWELELCLYKRANRWNTLVKNLQRWSTYEQELFAVFRAFK